MDFDDGWMAASLAGEPFDVLLNNAGVMACPPMKTKQGYEYQVRGRSSTIFMLYNLPYSLSYIAFSLPLQSFKFSTSNKLNRSNH